MSRREDPSTVERANTRLHPTPLTSALVDGCIDSSTDCSAGGARYNGSGIQGARLSRAPKYGDDDPRADRWVGRTMLILADVLRGRQNTRGGEYVAGFYSVTCHQAFGEVTGALPSGRLAGEPFSSGLSPQDATKGPTAALRSQASLPLHVAKNGVNFNLELPPWTLEGDQGVATLDALVHGAFDEGCMQVQINVLDPAVLLDAMRRPEKHRGLLVRVSGYSAYFVDLKEEMQYELIARMAD